MTHGSQQLRQFRVAIRDGASVEDAAETAGMSIAEARFTVAEDAKNPLPLKAYVPLGHNSGETTMPDDKPNASSTIAADELRLLIERYERLDEEGKGIADDKKDVLAEAKGRGYDTKAIRKIISIRKRKREEVQEENAILELYCDALGMQFALL